MPQGSSSQRPAASAESTRTAATPSDRAPARRGLRTGRVASKTYCASRICTRKQLPFLIERTKWIIVSPSRPSCRE